ncbi:thioredoxin family protein [Candidatus Puniceispirillum sp.]|nr:thioredoxin family protein [Candidatus Puniceispirillum sp.]
MSKIILFTVLLLIGSSIYASEKNGLFRLVYVFSEHCVFCKAWERDVGNLYGDTEYAKKAPLIKIDISLFSKQFNDLTPNVSVTPTFILMSGNDEAGRIVGYQNRDMFFWALSEYISH